ncbi:MAG: NUDIX hydrolase [Chloroflexi bacterium]|nr:NUDIX hydrolase [Chloroflexota bacterium]MBM3174964.1 NUDIX hydrolase [Chloroflexota bacterium]MBM4450956.1 NUDIX hydrolase [Chloroflexota bacterium]
MEKTISSKVIYEGRALKLRVDEVLKPNGKTTTREIVEHKDCVAIVVLDHKDNVIMVRQYRKAVGKHLLEIPAGSIDNGELPVAAVRRELQEEIGYLPNKIDKLGGFYSSPGYCSEYLHLYMASYLVPSRLEAEDTEDIKVERVPLSRIPDMIASGEICDAKSVAGLFRVISLGLKGS